MDKIFFLIFIYIFFSCNNKKETRIVETGKIDSVTIVQEERETERNKVEDNLKWDSISRHITDSLLLVVKQIQSNRNINIDQRINRIKKLYSSIGVGSVWQQSDIYSYMEGTEYDLLANELGALLTDANVKNYNLDSVFSVIFYPSSGDTIVHSRDNRLWVISFSQSDGGSGNIPYNIISWRNEENYPQGFITSKSDVFLQNLSVNAWWNEIYRLNSFSDKELYLMLGSQKDVGSIAIVVNLTSQDLILDYKGFLGRGMIGFDNSKKEKRTTIYNLGVNLRDEVRPNNYRFYEKEGTISFTATEKSGLCQTNTLIVGTLIFNGDYFTENLEKQKIEN